VRVQWLPLMTVPVLGLLTVLTGDVWLLLLASAVAGAGIAAAVLRPNLDHLEVVVALPARARVGLPVACTIEIRNNGGRTIPATTVRHHLDGLDDLDLVTAPIPPGGCAVATASRAAVARGHFTSGSAVVTSFAPFGLVVVTRQIGVHSPLVVHPPLLRVVGLPALPAPADRAVSRTKPDRGGVDVHGIREWTPGDGARQVHWRSTARRGRLVVLEREAPVTPGLTILVTGSASWAGWEELISEIASVALAADRDGRSVVLVSAHPGLRDLTAGRPVALMDWCAALPAAQTLSAELTRQAQQPQLARPARPARLAGSAGAETAAIGRALAAAVAGRSAGQLLVATNRPLGPWWPRLSAEAARMGVRANLVAPR
jgi:uncharacterized protein (DUF58 family)